jgi:hypothetical protein
MNAEELRSRTKWFTVRVMNVVAALPDNAQGRVIAYQLMKSGGSEGRTNAPFAALAHGRISSTSSAS